MQNSKDIQEPQDYKNDHDSIQDRLDGARHRNEAVDEPEKNTNYDQNHKYLNQRHDLLTSLFSEADAYTSAPRYALLSIACGFSVRAATVQSPRASGNPRRSA
jgi:hypothetical protein